MIREWKEATVLFLRKAVGFNNKSLTTIMDKLGEDGEFEKDIEAKRIWPLPKEAEASGSNRGEQSQGELFCSMIAGTEQEIVQHISWSE